jgi:putative protease
VEVKIRFCVGDAMELMPPESNQHFTLRALENHNGAAMTVAPGDGHVLYVALPPMADAPDGVLRR